ncbi:hypothetical protein [uncultured Pseudosulfitobacter sp.]|uniref:hypothetical protein n=1 Tax=uncultured Pseudosulfitobacter sp. TaxID=2854214 RepID=UPI0030D9AFDC|tara:strand:+ start:1562 stop:2227 length:666 start_codon:yes stop_codon:yes gene_type:complete
MSVQGAVVPDGQGRVRREISIQRLLEWAFADECAQVDFEDAGTLAQGYGHVGNAYRMAQRGALGCRIDGGGVSYPDPDADLVASAVATLPEGCGGRRMAVQIAELARARNVPDAFVGVEPRCEPKGWRENRFARRAETQSLGIMIDRSGLRPRRYDVRVCPVVYRPDGAQVAAARRNYLQWWSALIELRTTFELNNSLSRWFVSHNMPPMTPWKKSIAPQV